MHGRQVRDAGNVADTNEEIDGEHRKDNSDSEDEYEEEQIIEDEEEDDDGDEVMIASDLALSPDIDKDGNIISCTDDDLDDIENKKTNSNVLSLRKRRKRMRYSYSKLARTVLKWPAGHNIISSDLYSDVSLLTQIFCIEKRNKILVH